jgi:mannitol-1-phosphate 5-dehydrogenase
MRVIIIGAGRVGCGALGLAVALQGHEVVFAARSKETADLLESLGYDVEIRGSIEATMPVRGVRAVALTSVEFSEEVAAADQIYTSVRPDNLPAIAPVLATSILNRIQRGITTPLDVFCCENLKNAGSQIERLIFTNIPFRYATQVQQYVGFSAAISDRIVSGQETNDEGRLVFTADAAGDVLVDKETVKGAIETLPPFKPLDNFPASMEEKLFILNCGHAVCAYLGHLRGHTYIHEAMADELVNRAVVGAMLEAQQALQAKYGRALHYASQIRDVLDTFANPALGDTIARVGRDPLRKLKADDRLIGPAKLAYRYGIDAPNLIRGCAAALCYANPEDAQATELRAVVERQGLGEALKTVASLRPWNPLSRLIKTAYEIGPLVEGGRFTRRLTAM